MKKIFDSGIDWKLYFASVGLFAGTCLVGLVLTTAFHDIF